MRAKKTDNQRHVQVFGSGVNIGQSYRNQSQNRWSRGNFSQNVRKTPVNYGLSWDKPNDIKPIIDSINLNQKHSGVYYKDILDILPRMQPIRDNIIYYLILAGGERKGHPVAEVRKQYLFNLMNVIKKYGHEIGIRSMNALLEVETDNDENVNVIDFLQTFEKKGLDLNVKTYTEMARAYALQGNANAILSILSHLKEEQQTSQQSQTIVAAENGDAQQHGQGENILQPILNYLAYAEALCGQRENVYTITRSAQEQNGIYTKPIYLHAALGFAKKGDIKEVETIVQRTPVAEHQRFSLKYINEIYLTLLHHTLDALQIMGPYMHLDQNGKLRESTDMKPYLCHAAKLINDGKFVELAQILELIPENRKSDFELHEFPARTMLDYGLRMLDSGKPEELQNIVNIFKRPLPNKNTDDFFWMFIQEYFRRHEIPIDAEEAFKLYMRMTNTTAARRKFHKKTIRKLLKLAITEKISKRSTDNMTGSQNELPIFDKILQTIEQYDSVHESKQLRQLVMNDIISPSPSDEKKLENKRITFSDIVN